MAVQSVTSSALSSQLTSWAGIQAAGAVHGQSGRSALLRKPCPPSSKPPSFSQRKANISSASLPKTLDASGLTGSQFFGAGVPVKRRAPFGMRSTGRCPAGGVKAAMIEQDIPITYVNKTGIPDPEFSVVVFTKNENSANIHYKDVAWKVLQAQSGADFTYPIVLEVAAVYPGGGATLKAGPFYAELGDTWSISQTAASSTPLLKLVDKANATDTIVVKNIKPSGFGGKPYDIHLIKDGSPLVIQPAVGSSTQAVVQLTPTIYFGIVKDVQHGAIFNSLTDSQYNTPFQLLQYPGGLEVTLEYSTGSGEFTFTGAAKK